MFGIFIVALALVVALAPEVGMLAWLERRLLYYPTHDIAYPLTAFGAGAEEVRFGEHGQLHGVFVPADSALGATGSPPAASDSVAARPAARTIVFFHGNGGNLSHRAPLIARMRSELGGNVFIFDYQGYGQSASQPSEQATAADARAAIAYLRGRPDVDPQRVAYYGESLGGAVAIALATETPPSGLVVQSSFTSIAEMTGIHYPALRFLLPYASMRYESLAAIGRVRAPLLVIHGDADTLVPAAQGRQLFEAANDPKRLLIVPEAGHNDVIVRAGSTFWRALRDLPGFGTDAR